MQGLRQFASDIALFVRETLEFFQDKGHLRVFALLMFLVGLTSLCSAGANGSLRDDQWASDWLQNFSTEMLGAVITFVLFIGYIESRQGRMAKQAEEDQRRIATEAEEEQEKKRLILQMGSPHNMFAVEATRTLRARGWGFEGDKSLHGANLAGANLQWVNLQDAELQRTDLTGADLQNVVLALANLQNGYLSKADLRGAFLAGANLCGANLVNADLRGATIDIEKFGSICKLDETTVLPDFRNYVPKKGLEQLKRFTDPTHPDFWQPESHKENDET